MAKKGNGFFVPDAGLTTKSVPGQKKQLSGDQPQKTAKTDAAKGKTGVDIDEIPSYHGDGVGSIS